jgi:hypothetical protein
MSIEAAGGGSLQCAGGDVRVGGPVECHPAPRRGIPCRCTRTWVASPVGRQEAPDWHKSLCSRERWTAPSTSRKVASTAPQVGGARPARECREAAGEGRFVPRGAPLIRPFATLRTIFSPHAGRRPTALIRWRAEYVLPRLTSVDVIRGPDSAFAAEFRGEDDGQCGSAIGAPTTPTSLPFPARASRTGNRRDPRVGGDDRDRDCLLIRRGSVEVGEPMPKQRAAR